MTDNRAVYLIGAPGVGKSTLMAGLLAPFERPGSPQSWPCPPGRNPLVTEALYTRFTQQFWGYHLGITRDSFSGTDALGMSVNPQAVAWANDIADDGIDRAAIYGEGQRLANLAFLTALNRAADLTVLLVHADEPIRQARCSERGSTQSATWQKAARSRALNLADKLTAAGIRLRVLDGNQAPDLVLKEARSVLGW